jgi:hypothetical protein
VDLQQHITNRNQFSRDELMRHAGKYVAWSPDGTRILASAEELAQVAATVKGLGFDSAEVVLGFVPATDAAFLGGATLSGGGAA